jgi:hypothetical protein
MRRCLAFPERVRDASRSLVRNTVRITAQFTRRLHADQSGAISIVTLFAVMLLAVLMGMIINIGRHADRKVKMQNAVDDATYSGGVVMARSMNTFAFTNHLLCDVFAMTAYLREARDRNAESLTEPVLVSWEEVGPIFAKANFPKFAALGGAIPEKVRLEREMVRAFGEQNAAVSEQTLPTMEQILAEEMIPNFQRALFQTTPRLAQTATDEIARRQSAAAGGLNGASQMRGLLWRTDATVVGGENESIRSSLPVVDPTTDISTRQPQYMAFAIQTRREHAHLYLEQLNRPAIADFQRVAKMSQFATLWRGFTCGQLNKLLNEEYPDSNLPFVLRQDDAETFDQNQYLESQYMFVGVAYWEQMPERLPGLFQNPLDVDQATYAQVSLFLPRPRLRRADFDTLYPYWVYRERIPTHWDLMNQNWAAQLVPATSQSLPTILQISPPDSTIRPQNLGGISDSEFQRLNTH